MTQAANFSVPTTGPATPDVMYGRIDDNFRAAISGHSGASRPTYAEAGTIWQDTSVTNQVSLYFYDGTQDILIGVVDTDDHRFTEAAQPWVDVPTATSIDLASVRSKHIRLTGTTTVESFGSGSNGTRRYCRAAAEFTITASANIITPGGGNISVAASDTFTVIALGSGVWVIVSYTKASGNAWAAYTPTFTQFGTVSSPTMIFVVENKTVEIHGTFTTGTPGASEARLSLPSGLVSSPLLPTLSECGSMRRNIATANQYLALIEPSASYITFGLQNGGSSGLTKQGGSSLVSSAELVSIKARVPLA